ncbi:Rv3235 family protein [Hoyosella sp. YIM 151337]|uniref:Rv3235 family protein n=1 Tax=Hoyosella sp. YIM 151337 TaxID=2992742 RepID=UPI0035A9A701
MIDRKRPVSHLAQCTTPLVADHVALLAQRGHRGRSTGEHRRLLRVHVRVSDNAGVEAFCTYERGGRVLAMAARLDTRPGIPPSWVCTTLRLIV